MRRRSFLLSFLALFVPVREQTPFEKYRAKIGSNVFGGGKILRMRVADSRAIAEINAARESATRIHGLYTVHASEEEARLAAEGEWEKLRDLEIKILTEGMGV